ncbi:MAG: hypothetical protein NVSMB52_10210 [Chloroflexota bacterium]
MMLTSGASAATMLFYGDNLPSLKDFKNRFQFQNTLIRDRNGTVLYNLADVNTKGRGQRVVEPLTLPGHSHEWYVKHREEWLAGAGEPGIPVILQDATIATEDATFYTNPGFDPASIARAGYDNFVRGHVVSGASTITQQLIKEYLLKPSPTLSRKLEEVMLAAELTQKYSKSKILWYYLNSIPYGPVSIGAEAACETYFHKHLWDSQHPLTLAQAALLAGLPEAPSIYNPVNNFPGALARMKHVLALMYDHGYLVDSAGHPDRTLITQAVNEAEHFPRFAPPESSRRYPHFVQYVTEQMQKIPELQGKIYTGLDVYTTIDPRIQDMAQQTVTKQVLGLVGPYNVTDGALVSMDLRPSCYGCIRAMVGSRDFRNVAIGGQINMADTPRQPGSSFKPFNYEYAFEHGLGPASLVDDVPIAIPDVGNPEDGGVYAPLNYDKIFHGVVTLRTALDNSLNIPAVKVEQFSASVAGGQNPIADSIAKNAHKMGIISFFQDSPHCCGWATTLGGMEKGVRLVEETAAYGALATEGHAVQPVAIRLVRDRTTGKIIYDAMSMMRDEMRAGNTVIKPEAAYVMNNVLSDNASRCTPQVCEFGLDSPLNLGRVAAAKTGTTTGYTDNWTVGYTPDLVTGVWVGNTDNSSMTNSTGIIGAAPIWHDFMINAFRILNLPPKDWGPAPPNVYYGSICRQATNYGVISSSFSYDLYADLTPYCSVGSDYSSAPVVPPDQTAPQAPQVPQAPPPYTPPQQAPVAVPTVAPIQPAPVLQPTPVPVLPTVPPAPVIQPTRAPLPVQPAPTFAAPPPPAAQPTP